MSPAAKTAPTGTQSLERAMQLLREVACRGERGARLMDLVADTSLRKATAHRLLAAMIRERLLDQDDGSRRYHLGQEIFVLGTIASARFGMHKLDADALARLASLWRNKYAGQAIPLAALLCDRHLEIARGTAVALLYENAAGHTSRLTYAELLEYSKRFAGVLRSLGIEKGERVAILLPKGPELLIASVALWRLGAVCVPLFTAFGAPAICSRLVHSGARVVVTNGTFRGKVCGELPPGLRVVMVEGDGTSAIESADLLFWSALHATAPVDAVMPLSGDDPFVLLYAAGTSGAPKGLPVPVKALACIEANMQLALDVRNEDVYWHIADPAWGGGLYFAVLGPLLLGRATIFCDGPFDAGQVYRVLTKHRVTHLLAAPNWYRALRAAENTHPPPRLWLRAASSLGDHLPHDLVEWVSTQLEAPLHDHYGQIELGIVVANHHAPALQQPRRTASIGRAAPGFSFVVLDADGRETPLRQEGQLAIDTEKSPLFWFGGYYKDPGSTAARFRLGHRYYLTGDLVRIDGDGYFYHVGTMDDVITSAGYLIGPAEVENALTRHPAIAETAVVGKSDRLLGEIVKVFVVLNEGYAPSPQLTDEILRHFKTRLPAYAYAPEIEFVAMLPRTADGKLHRVALRDNTSGRL